MFSSLQNAIDRSRRFIKDKRGLAAIEFALIAPIMVALYLLTVEFQDYFTVDRKLTALTSALGDVISQDDVITNAEVTDTFTAIASMMTPYDSNALKMRITQVNVDNAGVAKVTWSDGKNMTSLTVGSVYALPANLVINNTSYVVSESQFAYTSIVGYLLASGITLDRIFYIQPRYVDSIGRTS